VLMWIGLRLLFSVNHNTFPIFVTRFCVTDTTVYLTKMNMQANLCRLREYAPFILPFGCSPCDCQNSKNLTIFSVMFLICHETNASSVTSIKFPVCIDGTALLSQGDVSKLHEDWNSVIVCRISQCKHLKG